MRLKTQDEVDQLVAEAMENALDNGHDMSDKSISTIAGELREMTTGFTEEDGVDDGILGLAIARWKGML